MPWLRYLSDSFSQCDGFLTPSQINDRHEFPFEIDLSEFLEETADRSQSWVYKLHGVLVHSGDLHGGHYFALIKPDRETRWLKFDDDRVTPVTDREVLEENYGGEALNGIPPTLQRNQVRAMKRFTNAYMLVYIRESAIDEVLDPFKDEDTPPHLSLCFFRSPSACGTDLFIRAATGRGAVTDRGQKEGTGGTTFVPHCKGTLYTRLSFR